MARWGGVLPEAGMATLVLAHLRGLSILGRKEDGYCVEGRFPGPAVTGGGGRHTSVAELKGRVAFSWAPAHTLEGPGRRRHLDGARQHRKTRSPLVP